MASVAAAFAALMLAASTLACRSGDPAAPAAQSSVRGLSLVVAQRSGGETAFWSVSPHEPSDRRLIARVAHDPEWGVRAALAPDGRRIAYTFMPPGGRNADRDAALAVVDPATRSARVLARGLDLRTAPVWMADGGRIIAQRSGAHGAGELVAVSPDRSVTTLFTAPAGRRVIPVAPVPGGAEIYVVEYDAQGARLLRLGEGRQATLAGTLASGPARGFVLSPDGASLAYLQLRAGDGRYEAVALDLATGEHHRLRPDRIRLEDTGVLWRDGWLVTATRGSGEGLLLAAAPANDLLDPAGFVAPATLQSGADGWLALRSFTGSDSRDPGGESLTLLGVDGRRREVEGGAQAIGWSGS